MCIRDSSELANGTVSVGIGTNTTNATVVDGQKSVPIGISYLDGVPSKSVIQLDPFAEPTNLSGLIGGELGGVLAFRDQMLGPAMTQLDDIAVTFISEINAAHAKGMDLAEKVGRPLFTSQPDFSVDYGMAKGNSTVSVAVPENPAPPCARCR